MLATAHGYGARINAGTVGVQNMATTWQDHGNNMARAWQEHGKNTATTWQEHGKSMART